MDLPHNLNDSEMTHDQLMAASFHKLVFINGVLGILFNIPLIILIIFRSRAELGSYKYLMLIFAIFNCTYPFFHMFVNPGLHIYRRAFVLIGDPSLPFEVGHYGLVLWCTLFGMSTCLITYHFVYRYFAVCKPDWLKLFTHPLGIVFLLVVFFFNALIWFLIFNTGGRNMQRYPEATHDELLTRFGINNHETATIGELYVHEYIWNNGTDGPLIPVAGFCGTMVIICCTSTLSVMIFCSIQIIRQLHRASTMSSKTRRMQVELFRALIAQTIVPVIAEYIPCYTTHLSSFFGVYIGDLSHVIILLISSLPFLDALCMTYFIRDYRTAIVNLFIRRVHVEDTTTATDSQYPSDKPISEVKY